MIKQRQEQRQLQKLEQRLTTSATRRSKDLVKDYVGKHVILELGEEGVQVCSGDLAEYDGRFVRVDNYLDHKTTLYHFLDSDLKLNPHVDLSSSRSVSYSIPSRLINANLIASIQLFDDVMQQKQGTSQ